MKEGGIERDKKIDGRGRDRGKKSKQQHTGPGRGEEVNEAGENGSKLQGSKLQSKSYKAVSYKAVSYKAVSYKTVSYKAKVTRQ